MREWNHRGHRVFFKRIKNPIISSGSLCTHDLFLHRGIIPIALTEGTERITFFFYFQYISLCSRLEAPTFGYG